MSYATNHLRNILQSIEAHGLKAEIEAYHGVLCLLPPHSAPDELASALEDWGVEHSEDYGWHITT